MNWYAVNTKPHQERKAEVGLLGLGVETFCPLVKQTKVIRRVRQTVVAPLFPCYLFAKLDISEHYRAATYVRGVRKIVAFGSTPAIVEEDLIQAIKNRTRNGYVTVPSQLPTRGQIVRIQDGHLRGLEAIFEREMSGQQRAVLMLRTLAYQARVVVPLEQIVNQ